MTEPVSIAGPEQSLQVLGVKLVGLNAESAKKLLLTVLLIVALFAMRFLFRRAAAFILRGREATKIHFWARQGIQLLLAVLTMVGIVSVWFDDPGRLATGLGLVTAGLAFALQKVVTSVAGYFVILRGRTFNVGDRIVMGGVRGDVVALGFLQTTIMEMGQPPPVQNAEPAMWVRARQYTGRLVTVSNSKIFDEPVFNYTRDFPYLWEELTIPVAFRDDRRKAEAILLESVRRHACAQGALSPGERDAFRRRYLVDVGEIEPRVYLRITDNWVELTARFLVRDHAIREVKDAMSRDLLDRLEAAGIGIASSTFEIVGLPPLRWTGTLPTSAPRQPAA